LNLLSTSQVFLSIAAVASLALGVCLDFSSTRAEGELPVDWVEGIAIVVAILIAVIVGSLKNWQKGEQFKTRSEKNEDRLVKVIYDGRERQIHAHEVVVGDVVLLEPGDVIPWDSVFLSGHNVPCDESSATGESDSIKKLSYEECIALRVKRPWSWTLADPLATVPLQLCSDALTALLLAEAKFLKGSAPMSLLLLEPRAWVCLSLFLSFELSDDCL
jgi:magnesium-transporting ATPase (P-type)